MRVHGTLLDVRGVGVLLLGPSGVGKSECALELVQRGNRFIADDVVNVERGPGDALRGTALEAIRHHIEIRGLGILCVPDLFGEDAVRDAMPIDLVCRLEPIADLASYERVGIERLSEKIEGIEVPSVRLPARPGGNMATVVEVAARDHRRRASGVNAAERLDARLRQEMRRS